MKNNCFLIILLCSGFAFNSFAVKKLTWSLQGVEYNVDTLSHTVIGPSTTHTALVLKGPVELHLFYITTDITQPNVNLKVIMGKDNLRTNVTIPNMPTSHSDTQNLYFAGVNADFFGGMGPVGTTYVNGEIYKSYKGSGWYAFGIDKNKKPYSGATYNTFKLKSNAGQASIKAVNVPRSENELVLYTSRKGSTTGTNASGVEIGAVPVESGGVLKSDGTTKMRVTTAPIKNVGNMSIPTGGFVFSANGFTEDVLSKMQIGEILEVTPTTYFDNVEKTSMIEIAGGCPMLLHESKILNTQGLLDHLPSRHPRTAVGYCADGTRLILLVVDGRGVSVGVTSKDLAAIMLNLECSEALNFDGGGSSTLYINKLGVQNIPSDGSLRAVKNGLFVTTPFTNDKTITAIRFADYAKQIKYNSDYTPVIYGYNTQGVLVDVNVKGAILSCDPQWGKIQQDGSTLLCNVVGTYALTASLGNITTSIPITVTEGTGISETTEEEKIIVSPNPIIAGEQAHINLGERAEVSIFSANGQLIKKLTTNKGTSVALPTESLMSGFYLISVTTHYSQTIIKFVIK